MGISKDGRMERKKGRKDKESRVRVGVGEFPLFGRKEKRRKDTRDEISVQGHKNRCVQNCRLDESGYGSTSVLTFPPFNKHFFPLPTPP